MNKYAKVWKANHIKALESLGFKATAFNRLRALENTANWLAVKYANGEIQGEEFSRRANGVAESVRNLVEGDNRLPGFFVNSDPRGYALKIESDNLPQGMHKDWGGYGILAPVF